MKSATFLDRNSHVFGGFLDFLDLCRGGGTRNSYEYSTLYKMTNYRPIAVKPCPHWRLAEFGDCRRKRRQSPVLAKVAVFGDSRRSTIVASVDRA